MKTFTAPNEPFARIVFPHLTTERIESALAFAQEVGGDSIAEGLAREFAAAVPSEANGLFEGDTPAQQVATEVTLIVLHTPKLIGPLAQMVKDGYRALPGQIRQSAEA